MAETRNTLNEPLLDSFNKMYVCHSKKNKKKKVVKTGGSLMQVESVALCNSFDLHLTTTCLENLIWPCFKCLLNPGLTVNDSSFSGLPDITQMSAVYGDRTFSRYIVPE